MALSRAMLIYIMLANEMQALATGNPTKRVSMSNKYHIKVCLTNKWISVRHPVMKNILQNVCVLIYSKDKMVAH